MQIRCDLNFWSFIFVTFSICDACTFNLNLLRFFNAKIESKRKKLADHKTFV